MPSPSNPGKTPFLNFFAFLFAFGWEGPVIISIGLRHDSTVEIVMGVLFAVFFWGLFGMKLLFALVKHLVKRTSAEEGLAAESPAKGDR